ncbi:methyltransferase domain-containing protein, partial [Amycolatopsis cihanbeyliensis]
AAPAVQAVAERLPVRDGAAEAALAVLTVHHWNDWRRGLAELRRVAPVRVVLAYDTRMHADYWFVREYVPEIAERELGRPAAADIAEVLGAQRVVPLPVPWDFTDGVFPAYWRRPAAYLDPGVRRNCSALAQADPQAVRRGLGRLRADLADGRWRDRHRDLLGQAEFDAGFRLLISRN